MIFSIVGRTPDGSAVGVAVAGDDLTQAAATVDAAGRAVVAQADVTQAADRRAEGTEQSGVVDARGGTETTTGAACRPWAGGLHGSDRSGAFAVQGHALPGPEVVDEMVAAWRDSDRAAPLAHRLVEALRAGQDVTGEPHRLRAAAVLVVTSPDRSRNAPGATGDAVPPVADEAVDLRVEDHPEPVEELARLLDARDRAARRQP